MTPDGRRTSEERIDAAIDFTVRELMDVDPPADLRARVINRIERPGASVGRVFGPGFKWTWIVAPVAAAAVLVIAVMLYRPEKPRTPQRSSSDVVLRTPETPAETAATIRSPAPLVRLARHATEPSRGRRTLVPAEAVRPAIQLEPLRPIDAIAVAPVAVSSLDTPGIGVPALAAIAQIELEPVNLSGERN
jgi:hypothetical protein